MSAIGTGGSSSSDLELTMLRHTVSAAVENGSRVSQLFKSAAWACSEPPVSGERSKPGPSSEKPSEDVLFKQDESRRLQEDEDGMQLVQNVVFRSSSTQQLNKCLSFRWPPFDSTMIGGFKRFVNHFSFCFDITL